MKDNLHDNELKQILGEIVIDFNLLELAVSMVIWELLVPGQDQKVGKTITTDLMFFQKIKLLRRVIKQKLPKDKQDEFDKLYVRLTKNNDGRNKYIHSLWLPNIGGKTLKRFSEKEFNKKGHHEPARAISDVLLDELKNFDKEIVESKRDLTFLLLDVADLHGQPSQNIMRID